MKTNERPVVIYGIGKRAEGAYHEVKGRGLTPVAFCSKTSQSTDGEKCGLPILSKRDVLERYGDGFDVWISPAYPTNLEIQQELLQEGFVPKGRILNPVDEDHDIYRSCEQVHRWFFLDGFTLRTCCSIDPESDEAVTIKPEDGAAGVAAAVRKMMRIREQLYDDMRSGRPCVCDKCLNLFKKQWGSYEGTINTFNVSFSYPCNLSCIYCLQAGGRFRYEADHSLGQQHLEMFADLLHTLERSGWIGQSTIISWAGGELSVNPLKKKYMALMENYDVNILTNGVVYDPDIARLTARDGGGINVSLDAGTRETYRLVKGADVFEKTLATLRRYRAEGVHMTLKYIVEKENCNEKDFEGFLDICRELRPEIMLINRDESLPVTDFVPGSEILEGMAYLAAGAKKRNIHYIVMNYLSPESMEYLEQRAAAMNG